MTVENRLSINCEQGRHHVCDGVYPWGINGAMAACRCSCGHPATKQSARKSDIFFSGQRWRVVETGEIGSLYGIRFAPRMAKGYEMLTILIDGAETTKSFLRRELEEVIASEAEAASA